MSDKRKEKLTDRQTTKELDIESLMEQLKKEQKDKYRGVHKNKKRKNKK